MPSNNAMDTSFADTLTKFFITEISTFSDAPDSILGNINKLSCSYGQLHITRPIADPYTDVKIQRKWEVERRDTPKIVQDLDLYSVGNGIEIPRVDYAGDPNNVQIHVANQGAVFRNGIEKLFVEGSSVAGSRIYGVADYPNATAGTINRPEMAYFDTTAGAWSGAANIRDDLIDATMGLQIKKFYGPYALLAPTIVKTMITEVIQYTATPTKQWINNTFGMPVLFSPFVHEGAAKTDFNCYLIDLSKAHLIMSPVQADAYYVNKDHAYMYDWEVYATVAFDPLYDGTEYLKGVAALDARAW